MAQPNPAVLADPADLTPDWLTEALQSAGHDVVVSALRSEAVGTGQMAHNERIFLDFERNEAGLPATLVGKFPSPSEESRASGQRGGYRSETRFYTDLAPQLAIAVPACHYGAIAEDEATFTLLLEDLAPKEQGDQIRGASDAEIEAAVRNLAGLHAPRWGDASLHDLDWMGGGIGDEYVTYVQMGTPVFIERYRDRLSDEDAATLQAFADGVKNWVDRRPATPTLVHGDYGQQLSARAAPRPRRPDARRLSRGDGPTRRRALRRARPVGLRLRHVPGAVDHDAGLARGRSDRSRRHDVHGDGLALLRADPGHRRPRPARVSGATT
jgi:hypothetical protein